MLECGDGHVRFVGLTKMDIRWEFQSTDGKILGWRDPRWFDHISMNASDDKRRSGLTFPHHSQNA